MIYVWLVLAHIMQIFESYEEFWDSYAYISLIKDNSDIIDVMVERNTSLWRYNYDD